MNLLLGGLVIGAPRGWLQAQTAGTNTDVRC